MKLSRRTWISGLIGTITWAFWQSGVAEGETAPSCEGVVSDVNGVGIDKLIVQIVEPTGRVQSDITKRGKYKLPAPVKEPYIVVFREPQGKTQIFDVRQLTGGMAQQLSVTIDSNGKTFPGIYSALQALESLSAFTLGLDGMAASGVLREIPFREWGTVRTIMGKAEEAKLSNKQREFLNTKSESVERLMKFIG